jgi:hypothetical protein
MGLIDDLLHILNDEAKVSVSSGQGNGQSAPRTSHIGKPSLSQRLPIVAFHQSVHVESGKVSKCLHALGKT